MTQQDIDALQTSGLSRKTPYAMLVSGYLSIARYYGGVIYEGERYTYFADADELVRDDVLVWLKKRKKKRPTRNSKT